MSWREARNSRTSSGRPNEKGRYGSKVEEAPSCMKARFDVPPTNWDEVHAGYGPETAARTKWLQNIVAKALPQCTESVQGAKMMGYSQYWLDNRQEVLAMISPEDNMVKLYVHHIKKDRTGALKLEGAGKNTRHVKLWLDQEYDADAIRGLLEQVFAARAAVSQPSP